MNTSLAQGVLGSHSYTDLASLNKIRSGAKNNQRCELADVGRQFESMFIRMVLKSMREANAVFSEGNFLNSSETQFRQDMLDDQLSISLTEGQGIGLASSLVKQLGQRFFSSNESTTNESAANKQDTTADRINNPIERQQRRPHKLAVVPPPVKPILATSSVVDKQTPTEEVIQYFLNQ